MLVLLRTVPLTFLVALQGLSITGCSFFTLFPQLLSGLWPLWHSKEPSIPVPCHHRE